jgi:GNAT superfamily N-acetyltransferase
MILAKKTNTLVQFTRQYGLGSTLKLGLDRTGRRVCGLQVTQMVWLTPERASPPEPKGEFTYRFLTAEDIDRFQDDPANDLTPRFRDRLLSGKHRCYAALDGDQLAAYGWYALEEVQPEDCFGFGLRLPSHAAYMYKGLTRPEYRGRRLHGYLMCRALQEMQADGVTRLISSVDWTNVPSLKSCARIGYEFIGCVVRWRQWGRERMHVSPRARREGVEFITP